MVVIKVTTKVLEFPINQNNVKAACEYFKAQNYKFYIKGILFKGIKEQNVLNCVSIDEFPELKDDYAVVFGVIELTNFDIMQNKTADSNFYRYISEENMEIISDALDEYVEEAVEWYENNKNNALLEAAKLIQPLEKRWDFVITIDDNNYYIKFTKIDPSFKSWIVDNTQQDTACHKISKIGQSSYVGDRCEMAKDTIIERWNDVFETTELEYIKSCMKKI